MRDSSIRTVTASGNVIHQRTRRGWVNSMGFWALLLPVSILLLAWTLPPQEPYFDTAVTGLLFLVCAWRVVNAARQMLVALGDNHLQYIGMGRAWHFYFRDLAGVEVADRVTAFSLPVPSGRPQAKNLPRHLIFTMHNGNRVNIRLSWFDGAALLQDLEARLPKKVKRSERYKATIEAIQKREAEN